jgi:hypothetical protein
VPADVAARGLAELEQLPLVLFDDRDGRRLSAGAEQIVERLVAERRAGLARLLERWPPDQYDALAALLTRLAHELVHDPPALQPA